MVIANAHQKKCQRFLCLYYVVFYSLLLILVYTEMIAQLITQ